MHDFEASASDYASGLTKLKRRLVLNTLLNAVGTGWGFLISLLLTPFLLRALGKESYGVWILITSFSVASGYLSLLEFGFGSSIVKYVAEYNARREISQLNVIVSAGLYLFGGIGIFSAIALVIFGAFFLTRVFSIPADLVPTARLLLYILAIQILFEFPGLVFFAVLGGLQRFELLRAIEIARLGLYALLLVVLLSNGFGLVALGLTNLVITAGRTTLMATLSLRLLPQFKLASSLTRRTLGNIAKYSGQIFVLRINAVVYDQMDKAIIGALLTSTLLTDYDIANKIQNLVLASITFTNSLMVPAASELNAMEDRVRLQTLFLKGTKYTLAICLPLAVAIMVLAEPLIRMWIGPKYVYDAGITRLFVSYLIWAPLTSIGYNIMIGIGQVRPLIWVQSITTAINLIVSLVLASRIGVAGVIWGTVIASALALAPYLWHFLKTLNISWGRFWHEAMEPTYPIVVLFAMLLYSANQLLAPDSFLTLAGFGLAGMMVYGALFAVFGLTGDERSMLLHVISFRGSGP